MDKLRLIAETLIREEKMEGDEFRRLMESETPEIGSDAGQPSLG